MKLIQLILILILSATSLLAIDTLTLNQIEIVGIKPIKEDPLTLTTIDMDSVKTISNDPFFTINRRTPSVFSQSDNGTQYGYSYIRMRGLDQTRINFTLNGIPLNEMEDQGIYFSNMPGFINNIGEIQIQRGIGMSKYGTTSFTGSINLETKSLFRDELFIDVGQGSFSNFNTTLGLTKLVKNKISLSSNLSYLHTNGFRDHSGTRGFNYFGQIGYFAKKDILKIYGFTGKSKNGMSWLAPDMETLNKDYTINLNSSYEKDEFNQNLIAINWVSFKRKNIRFNSSVYLNNINGYYTTYLDSITLGRFNLNSYQSGLMSNIIFEKKTFKLNGGANFNYYQRKHSLADNELPDELFYSNVGYKQDIISFIKINKNINYINLFADVQYRYVNFNYDKKISYSWNFVNPKLGIKYIRDQWDIYLTGAVTSREVTRSDLLRGYDNVNVITNDKVESFNDTFYVNSSPERLYNVEIGGSWNHKGLVINTNYYLMFFNDERVSYGEINYIGLSLKKPVDNSLRTGLELDVMYSYSGLSIGTNLSASKSKIKEIDDKYKNVEAFASPKFLMNNYIEYKRKHFTVNLNGSFVSKMYLDNTNRDRLTTPRYYTLNTFFGLTWDMISINSNFNNILNKKSYLPGGVSNDTGLYYPNALFNFNINLRVKIW